MSKHRADTPVRFPKHRAHARALGSAPVQRVGNANELLATLYGTLAVHGSLDTEKWNQAVTAWSQPSE